MLSEHSTDPMDEAVEVSWLSAIKRFDEVIYPTIFAPRGFDRSQALVAWEIAGMRAAVEEVVTLLREERD